MTGLERAIAMVGGQNALAKAIGIPQSTIWNWVHLEGHTRRKGEPPAHHALKISDATGGAVKPSDLRPDVYPPEAK